MTTLRLGTRGSQLALWQANTVARLITESGGPHCELVVIRTAGDEQLRHFQVAARNRLVKRRGMRVTARRVETIRIFTGVQQDFHHLQLTRLRCERERAMAIACVGGR